MHKQILVSAATLVSDEVNPPSYVVDGDQNVELQCTVTLSSTIGPDYSALSIDWRDSTDTIINNCSSPQLHGNTQISDTFSCNLTLATISATSAGLYTCNGNVIGSKQNIFHAVFNVTVRGTYCKCTVYIVHYTDIAFTQDHCRMLILSHQLILFLDSQLCSLVKCTL